MTSLRKAGPNERRCIVRQALGYYRTLVVGGIYTIDKLSTNLSLESSFIKGLKHCVASHPILSACIVGEETETPEFARPAFLDLNDHIDILATQQSPDILDEKDLIKLVLAQSNDHVFTGCDRIPPWKITVLPLLPGEQHNTSRYLILFGYYHSHGDGKSGLAFHKTLLSGLKQAHSVNCAYDDVPIVESPSTPLLPTLEMAGRLSISWSYLLSPLLGAYLPSFVANPLGIRASATPEADDQWAGNKTFFDVEGYRTCVEVISVGHDHVQRILQACREHNAKFTGLLHQIIVQALCTELPAGKAGCFVSQTAVDLRSHLNGINDDDMALCPTAYYELFPRTLENDTSKGQSHISDSLWDAARSTTQNLAERASTLNDQPVGLLAYLRNMYPWTKGQVGKRRECSYEVSNIMSFKPGPLAPDERWDIESMIFSQPANVSSGCLNINVVSRHQGDLTVVVSWQAGALDVQDEQTFAENVGNHIATMLKSFSPS
ncbi:hypothetical protein E4T52_13033 [Aureobasidium sp. EXF-3400]|nr:hypothetical protein E4T51_00109 [Aureobasidium sp. EXF-12344]KAI4771960.1 hypothetical protein E4T52_13033 [Aureobasidium sp. EXF-3400]